MYSFAPLFFQRFKVEPDRYRGHHLPVMGTLEEKRMALPIPDNDRTNELLDGVLDLHCHAGPCLYGKEFDEIQTARMMRSVGYRGVLFKQHVMGANRIEFVRQAVPGIEIFGSIALNNFTGGLNPFSVAAAIIFGAKGVKFPNIHAAHHRSVFGTPTYADIPSTAGAEMEARIAAMSDEGITIFNENRFWISNNKAHFQIP